MTVLGKTAVVASGAMWVAPTASPRVSLIWAMDRNRVIGKNNALPWRLPSDLTHFKQTTTGHPVIMGRNTYASLGRPLPERANIVLTRDKNFSATGCIVANTLPEALQLAASMTPEGKPEVFVIGGEALYKQALAFADRLYVTLVEAEVEGDARFPDFDWAGWREVSRTRHASDERNPFACTFLVYERSAEA